MSNIEEYLQAAEIAQVSAFEDNPYIERGRSGAPKAPTIPAVKWWLEHPSTGLSNVRYNVLDGVVEADSLPWEYRAHAWTDADTSYLLADLQSRTGGYPKSERDLMHALTILAHSRKYDPLLDMLDGLPTWDGKQRADLLFVDFLGADDTPYNRAVSRLLLNGAWMRAYRPGCKFDSCVVLSSRKQGIGKSTLIRRLAMQERFFTDSLGNIATKEAPEILQGKWLIEVSELESLRRREVETIKQFISRQEDRYRAPYGRLPETRPRRCVFVGTTNSTAFLADRTGNRRFLPIECDVNPARLDVFSDDAAAWISQAWAEVAADYRNTGALPLVLPRSVEEAAESARESFSADDPTAAAIAAWIERNCRPGERICTMQIAEQVLGMPREKLATGSAAVSQIVQALDLLPTVERTGKQRHSPEYGVVRCWTYRPGSR